jgi:GNAT superfamily N-acetyltransferase
MLHVSGPNWKPSAAYYDCRFQILRKPLGFDRGAEILTDDVNALHAYIELNGTIVAVGRSHMIPISSDGAQSDFPGQDGPKTPPFSRLDDDHRPAIQIRQMGTLDAFRRNGFAAKILNSLEEASKEHFDATCGFLQAREVAIPFYESQGWQIIDDPYSIPNVGPHRSMMKRF